MLACYDTLGEICHLTRTSVFHGNWTVILFLRTTDTAVKVWQTKVRKFRNDRCRQVEKQKASFDKEAVIQRTELTDCKKKMKKHAGANLRTNENVNTLENNEQRKDTGLTWGNRQTDKKRGGNDKLNHMMVEQIKT